MKKRIVSIISAITIGVSLFSQMPPLIVKASDEQFVKQMEEKLDNIYIKDKQSKSVIQNQNEVVEILVQLEGQAVVDNCVDSYSEEALFIEEGIKFSQEGIIKKVEKLTGYKVNKSFAYLVNGFSIQGKRSIIDEIAKLNGVKSVVEAPKFKSEMFTSKGLSNVSTIYKDYGYKGQGMVVSVIDSGFDFTHKDFKITDSSKNKLTEDKVNNIINNELEGRGKYFSEKIPYGYNYTDFDNNIEEGLNKHGQHVAGIIGANGSDEGEEKLEAIKGVAPEVQILAMKVGDSDDENGALTGDIILALEDSVKLGADVVNMSFGSDGYVASSEDIFYNAIEKATDNGVLVVNAAGNAQTFGSEKLFDEPIDKYNLKDTSMVCEYSPSTLMVGAVNNTGVFGDGKLTISNSIINLEDMACTFVDDIDLVNQYEKIYYFYDKNYYLVDQMSFKNKILIVSKVDNYYDEIYKKASEEGAKLIIEVSKLDGTGKYDVSRKVPVLKIGKTEGESVIEAIKKKPNEKCYINLVKEKNIAFSPSGKEMATFSSWGPSPDLELRPDVVAPGGNIYSTISDNKYDTYSGTSMSTPFVSGAEAIFYQSLKDRNINLQGKDKVMLAKQMFMNTAEPLISNVDNVYYSPRRQGAGLIQLDRAIKNMTTLTNASNDSASLSLKNISNTKEFKLKLKNYSSEDVTYITKQEKLYTEYLDKDKYIHEKEINGARITFDAAKVTVPANSEVYLTGRLTIDEGALENNNFVEGFITLKSEDTKKCDLSMPVLAFYGDYSKESIVDIPSYYKNSLRLDYTAIDDEKTLETIGYELDNKGNIKINPDNIAFSPNGDEVRDSIMLNAYFLRAAKEYYIQILDKNKKVLEMPYGNNYVLKGFGYGRVFDGTIYDSTIGKKKNLEEGQYYARFIITSFMQDSEKQILDIPFKIDLTAPKVNINSVYTTEADEDGKEKYNIDYIVSDESGIAINSLVAFNKNADEAIEVQSVKLENGHYIASFEADKGSINANEVTLAIMDNAGNKEVVTKECKIVGKNAVSHNLEDNMSLNYMQKDFYFYGNVRFDVAKLYINDKEVEIDNSAFRQKLDYTQGENTYIIKAKDKNNKVIYNKKYVVNVDTKRPQIVSMTSDNKLVSIDNEKHTIKIDKSVESFDLTVKYSEAIFISDAVGIGVNYDSQDSISPIKSNKDNDTFTYNIKNNIGCLYFNVVDFFDNMAEEIPYYVYNDSVYAVFEKAFSAYKQSVVYSKQENDEANLKINFVDNSMDLSKIKILINGSECNEKIEDGVLEYKYKLNQGFNKAEIIVYYDEDEIYHKKLEIYYDNVAPTIKFNEDLEKILSDIKPNGKIYIGKDKPLDSINVAGTVTDDSFDYHLFINNNFILKTNFGSLKNVKNGDKDPLEREFSQDIILGQGDNYISFFRYDSLFNEEETILKIHNGPIILDKPIYEEVDNGYIIKAQVEEDLDYIEVSFDGENYEKYEQGTVLNKNQNIFARAISYTGQSSEILNIHSKSQDDDKDDDNEQNKEDNKLENNQEDKKEESQLSETGDNKFSIYLALLIVSIGFVMCFGVRYKTSRK